MILDVLAMALHREREARWASDRHSLVMVREARDFDQAFTGSGERLAELLRPAARPVGASEGGK